MKGEDQKYREIISMIKDNPPVLRDPEALTADVMGRIDKLSQSRSSRKRLLVSGWIAAIAATFLLCFLLNETMFYPVNQYDIKSGSTYGVQATSGIKASEATSPLPDFIQKDVAPADKYELLLPWIKNKRETRAKRMQIRIDFLLHTDY
ncbi:hypothetical protein [Bacteroides sp. 51]|uniref:hypothetical protein n=1 Tax=Bacteroides sp. 51 TaxID=2302938 RepID=UPI0013D4699C|nr:hypothetical protein [Bacteroides sp. 51]NDV83611.1 hypothetical protein [Bacteroides sp. 51]